MAVRVDLPKRVAQIASEVRDLTTNPVILLQSPAFREVCERPAEYTTAAIMIYADPATPDLNKEITGYAMQRLPLDDLLRLISIVADLVEQKKLAPRLLEKLAFPSLDWNTRIRENHDRPGARLLLERLARMEQLSPERRSYITDEVLTGIAKQDCLDLRAAGQIP